MSTVPNQLLTLNTAQIAGKTTGKSVGKVDLKSAGTLTPSSAQESTKSSEGAGGSFMDLLAGMFDSAKANPNPTSAETNPLQGEKSQEQKLDVLLKQKSADGKKSDEQNLLTPEKVISPETLKGLDQLLNKDAKVVNGKVVNEIESKIASTGSNLDQLLKTLKSQPNDMKPETISSEAIDGAVQSSKEEAPLEFILNKSQNHKNGIKELGLKNPEMNSPELNSLLGLSSEEFVGQLKVTDQKGSKGQIKNSDQSFSHEGLLPNQKEELNLFAQKNMNQNMKAYGQKQNLLNDHLIKSPKDLLTKDKKSITALDELKTPDMKIGADLSQIKEAMIPVNQKVENQLNTQAETKVLDLSKMNPANTDAIIKKISDYIEQSQVGNKESIDLTVRHDSLGQFKIQVNKPMGGASLPMDMQITTTTAEGHDFFVKHEVSLMKNLSQAGIQLSDLRIVSGAESSSFAQNDSRQNSQSQYNQATQKDYMNFDSGTSSDGSQRRRELWQEARANQQRYGA